MKEIVQNYNSGELNVDDVPAPIYKAGSLLVRTVYSLVSAGTERTKVSQEARTRPHEVKQTSKIAKEVNPERIVHAQME